jgi:DNA-binding beta-propeller fold protein YncE
MKKLACVTALMISTIPFSAIAQSGSAAKTTSDPLTLKAWTPLPGIEGDFDFLAVDQKRNHLFIAAEEHHTIEMFDAVSGKHLQSIPGVKAPHTLAYVAEKDELIVADGGDYSTSFLSAEDFHVIDRVALIDGSVTGKTDSPDVGYYDAKRRIFFIGNGGKSANLPYSEITEINVDTHKIAGRIRVDGINLEAIAIDEAADRLYVNVRDKKQIGVIDLATSKVVDTWAAPDLNLNTSMAFDPSTHRLFVVGRKPGLFYAFDTKTGKVVQQMSCVNIADGMIWDPQMKRVYIAGSQGLSVIHQDSADHYSKVVDLPTNGGKTALLIPELKQLYVVHPKTSIDDAGLLVYRVNP